jgi:hypothetical protein
MEKIDLNFFLLRSSIKSIINRRKKESLKIRDYPRNYHSETDFYSDYIYDLYKDYYELVDFYGSYVYILNSVQSKGSRNLVDISGHNDARGAFQRIRSYERQEIKKMYENIPKNYDFQENSEMIKYKVKAIVSYDTYEKDYTGKGNYLDSTAKFSFSTLDLFEKGIQIDPNITFIFSDGVKYRVSSITKEKYLNNEIFLISVNGKKEMAKLGE